VCGIKDCIIQTCNYEWKMSKFPVGFRQFHNCISTVISVVPISSEWNPHWHMKTNTNTACWRIHCQLFVDSGCRVVSATDPSDHIISFLGHSRHCFFQVTTQLCSRGWVDPVPDPLLLRKSGSARNRTQTCIQELWPLEHGGGETSKIHVQKRFAFIALILPVPRTRIH
jgi:hypothetical protein